MKNYYEILEVDKNASQEIIEKAYKTLAKRYHPDLQDDGKEQEYEEKMKLINEAYEILSNDFKREAYNQSLQNEIITKEQYERLVQENYMLRQQLERMANSVTQDNSTFENISSMFNEEINKVRQQAYQDAYVDDMKSRGYKIIYKHDLKYYLKLIGIIIAIILIFILIYQIPFVKNFFNNIYEENFVVKIIVDALKNTFTTGF